MSQKNHISIVDQVKKFGIESFSGFLRVIIIGIGRRLGIFQYLFQKAISTNSRKKIKSVSFTSDELKQNLKLNERYLDAWLNAALEVGIFEVDDFEKKSLKTTPHVYDILLNEDSPFFFADAYGSIFRIALQQKEIFNNFKSGELIDRSNVSEDIVMEGHRTTARMGLKLERYFSKNFPEFKRNLLRGGTILEVGCGYGFNLQNWVKKYPEAKIVGNDIDEKAINYTKELILKNNWEERVNVLNISLTDNELLNKNYRFDLIILNQIFHEIEIDENYRKKALNNLYSLLKDGGLILVGESMVSELFDQDRKPQLIEALHKWQEICVVSKFYNEKNFRNLISSIPFQSVELIKEVDYYFWVLRK